MFKVNGLSYNQKIFSESGFACITINQILICFLEEPSEESDTKYFQIVNEVRNKFHISFCGNYPSNDLFDFHARFAYVYDSPYIQGLYFSRDLYTVEPEWGSYYVPRKPGENFVANVIEFFKNLDSDGIEINISLKLWMDREKLQKNNEGKAKLIPYDKFVKITSKLDLSKIIYCCEGKDISVGKLERLYSHGPYSEDCYNYRVKNTRRSDVINPLVFALLDFEQIKGGAR